MLSFNDINPLTVVRMKYGPMFVILNADCEDPLVPLIQLGSRPWYLYPYDLEGWMEEYVRNKKRSLSYGFGRTVGEAFEDYRRRCGDHFF